MVIFTVYFVWIILGFCIYMLEILYRKLFISKKNRFTPEEFILYGVFGVVSIFFFLYTVLNHIQRMNERRRKRND